MYEDDVMKNEKYPQIVLEADGTYKIYVEPEVSVHFESKKSIEDFVKNKKFTIIGKNYSKLMVDMLRSIMD